MSHSVSVQIKPADEVPAGALEVGRARLPLDPALASILERELAGGVRFFWERANTDPASPGYGLIPDRVGRKEDVASLAATGFGLSALAIGAARGLLPRTEARERVRGTLETLTRVPRHRGFWTHFVDIGSCERWKRAEYSTIDTALALNGAIAAASYFQDPKISACAEQLLNDVDWGFLIFQDSGRTLFRMAYNPDRDGDYGQDANSAGMISAWDMTAEQLCMYLLAAGHPAVPADVAQALYAGFDRPVGTWGGEPFVYTPGGAMFVYQFSHAWFPFQSYRDAASFDWFANSRRAILANRAWGIDHHAQWRTLDDHLWGLTAGEGIASYVVSGTPVVGSPCQPYVEGTVAAYSLTASLPFIPGVAAESLRWLDANHPGMWGPYGLWDAINLERPEPRYIKTVLGIDKGPSLLMVDNWLHGTTWDAYAAHPWIQRAVAKLGWATGPEL
ncbi:MAG: glucoamylase family protein [Candidatus Nanopelagicales bacterium]